MCVLYEIKEIIIILESLVHTAVDVGVIYVEHAILLCVESSPNYHNCQVEYFTFAVQERGVWKVRKGHGPLSTLIKRLATTSLASTSASAIIRQTTPRLMTHLC